MRLLLSAGLLLLLGLGGCFTASLRVSGWGMNAELSADFHERQDSNRPERPNRPGAEAEETTDGK
jgi:hypothetical protein